MNNGIPIQVQQLQAIAGNPNHPHQQIAIHMIQHLMEQAQQQVQALQQGQADPQAGAGKKKAKKCKKCGGGLFDSIGNIANMFTSGSTPLEKIAGPQLTSAFKNAGYDMLGEHLLGGKKKGKKGGADGDFPQQGIFYPLVPFGQKKRPLTEAEKEDRKKYGKDMAKLRKREALLHPDEMGRLPPGYSIPASINGIINHLTDEQLGILPEPTPAQVAAAARAAQVAAQEAALASASSAAKAAIERKAKRDAAAAATEKKGSGKYKRKGGADSGTDEELSGIFGNMDISSDKKKQTRPRAPKPPKSPIQRKRESDKEDDKSVKRKGAARTKGAVDKKPRKVSKWVTHVKAFAAKHNLTYPCAMSNAQCKEEYKNPPVEAPKPKKRLIRVAKLSKPVEEAPKPKKRLIRKSKPLETVPIDIPKAIKTKFEKEYAWGVGRVSEDVIKELNIPLKYKLATINWIENGSKIILEASLHNIDTGYDKFYLYLDGKDGKRAGELLTEARNQEIYDTGMGRTNDSDVKDYGLEIAEGYLKHRGNPENVLNFFRK